MSEGSFLCEESEGYEGFLLHACLPRGLSEVLTERDLCHDELRRAICS